MLYYFNSQSSLVTNTFSEQLNKMIMSLRLPNQPIIIMCIGSDRSTGDSLGPVIGYKLKRASVKNVAVVGTLNSPVHAANLESTLKKSMLYIKTLLSSL